MENGYTNARVMSTEALIMSLLGQIQCLESERDNARLLAARMKERLEQLRHNNNVPTSEVTSSSETGGGDHIRLAKMVKDVSLNTLKELELIVTNEEQRYYNLKELSAENETDQTVHFQGQLAVCKQHYEKLLEEAENEKTELRRNLKEKQDLLLDRDIKIKELERKLRNSPSTQS